MRFTANQLRLLQEDLAPALPALAAPPEMVHLPSALPAPPAEPQAPLRLPCGLLPAGYCLASAALAVGAPAPALPLPALLAWHALSAPPASLAQVFGLACALLLPAACAEGARPAVGAVLSVFFALACPGHGLLKLAACATPLVVFASAALAQVSPDAERAGRAARCTLLLALCAQAVLSTARLRAVDLVVCARQR